jgi:ribosomal protein S18 acetylase RimI-like enzyme
VIADSPVTIRPIGPESVDAVMAAGMLFDHRPTPELAAAFLQQAGCHLLIAFLGDDPIGFVSGIEIGHPDKAPEMLLYELGVDRDQRRRGVGRELTRALRDLARERRCRGMWVAIDPENSAAMATYRSAGAGPQERAAIMEWTFHESEAR